MFDAVFMLQIIEFILSMLPKQIIIEVEVRLVNVVEDAHLHYYRECVRDSMQQIDSSE